jgi:hypothetical protein
MPKLTYHQATCDMLGVKPVISEQRVAQFQQRERQLSIRFPAAVMEWFSLVGSETNFGYEDVASFVPPEQLGEATELAQGYLRLTNMLPNEGTWYVRLGTNPDPKIGFVRMGQTLTSTLASETGLPWHGKFSTFLFNALVNTRYGGFHAETGLDATDQMPTLADLRALKKKFHVGPVGYGEGYAVLKFFTADSVLSIMSMPIRGDADWSLRATSEEALVSLAKEVWQFGTLAETFKGRPKSRKLLKELRNQMG